MRICRVSMTRAMACLTRGLNANGFQCMNAESAAQSMKNVAKAASLPAQESNDADESTLRMISNSARPDLTKNASQHAHNGTDRGRGAGILRGGAENPGRGASAETRRRFEKFFTCSKQPGEPYPVFCCKSVIRLTQLASGRGFHGTCPECGVTWAQPSF